MSNISLHLASGSPRRRDILDALGLQFSYGGTDINESRAARETAEQMVLRLALQKAQAAQVERPGHAILGFDTAVVLDDRIFGKPTSREDGLMMLDALSGRTHDVLTGVALLHDGRGQQRLSRSRVTFRQISAAEGEAYWHTGEPRDKAGGYAIQGCAAVFVSNLHGSYSGVIGLPVYETAGLLQTVGVNVITNE